MRPWNVILLFSYFDHTYFNKRLALVNGIVSPGSGVGTAVLSSFVNGLQNYTVQKICFTY